MITPEFASAFMALVPAWVVLYGVIRGADQRQKYLKQASVLAVGIFCIFLLVYSNSELSLNNNVVFGSLLALISTFSYAFGTIYTKSTQAEKSPLNNCVSQHFAGLILSAIAVLALDPLPKSIILDSDTGLRILIYASALGLFSNFGAWYVYNKVMSSHSSLLAALCIMLVPMVCFVVAEILYNRGYNLLDFALCAMIVISCFFVVRLNTATQVSGQ